MVRLKMKIPSKNMHEKPTNTTIIYSVYYLCIIAHTCFGNTSQIASHHVTKHNTPIHKILSTAPQLSISQKVLGALPEDGNVMPKHVGDTIYN
jgi:hypothetical protein